MLSFFTLISLNPMRYDSKLQLIKSIFFAFLTLVFLKKIIYCSWFSSIVFQDKTRNIFTKESFVVSDELIDDLKWRLFVFVFLLKINLKKLEKSFDVGSSNNPKRVLISILQTIKNDFWFWFFKWSEMIFDFNSSIDPQWLSLLIL